jgi:hypothetical protein
MDPRKRKETASVSDYLPDARRGIASDPRKSARHAAPQETPPDSSAPRKNPGTRAQARAEAEAAKAAARRNRHWYRKMRYIGTTIILVVIVIAAVVVYSITRADNGGFSFAVVSFKCGASSLGISPFDARAAAGTSWCVATINVTNHNDHTQDFYARYQRAITTGGQLLAPSDYAMEASLHGMAAIHSRIQAGMSLTVDLPFDVESSTTVNFLDLCELDSRCGFNVKVSS